MFIGRERPVSIGNRDFKTKIEFENYMLYLQYLERFEDNGERIRWEPHEDLSDVCFRKRFRLKKETVRSVLDLIGERLQFPTRRNNPISPRNRLLIALRFYATGSFQEVIGDVCNVDRTTTCRIIHEVSDIIASLSPQFIKLPLTQREQREVMEGFFRISGFPGVLGTLDALISEFSLLEGKMEKCLEIEKVSVL